MEERTVWLTDKYGAERKTPVTTEELFTLLDSLTEDEEEHNSISLTDSNGWNLEFTPRWVLLENVEDDGEELGSISWTNKLVAIQVASEFLSDNFEALLAHDWTA